MAEESNSRLREDRMGRYSRIAIALPLLLFLVAFAGNTYDQHLRRSPSFSNITGVVLGLLFLSLGLLALHSELASKQRRLEERIRSLEERIENLSRSAS